MSDRFSEWACKAHAFDTVSLLRINVFLNLFLCHFITFISLFSDSALNKHPFHPIRNDFSPPKELLTWGSLFGSEWPCLFFLCVSFFLAFFLSFFLSFFVSFFPCYLFFCKLLHNVLSLEFINIATIFHSLDPLPSSPPPFLSPNSFRKWRIRPAVFLSLERPQNAFSLSLSSAESLSSSPSSSFAA